MKKSTTSIVVVVIIIILVIIYFFIRSNPIASNNVDTENPSVPTVNTDGTTGQLTATSTINGPVAVIGTSVQGRDITAYHYGTGPIELLVIGGAHGGYEWNTSLVAYQLMDYLKANPSAIPANMTVTVIPVMNPDGLIKVIGTTTATFSPSSVSTSQTTLVAGRFNGNKVDLNRNFDCDWQTSGVWQNTPVSGGQSVFSEPESQAIRDYVQSKKPTAVLAWYSASGGVYASSCHNGVSSMIDTLTKTFASASGYTAHSTFDDYATTGDMTNWLAKIGTPAISVLLTNHTDTEWTKNLAGIQAVLTLLSK